VKEQLIKNREPTLKLLKGLKVAPAALPPTPQHVKNKVTAPVGAGETTIANKAQADRAAKVANRAREIQTKTRLGHGAAWQQADSEIPAL